LEKKTVEIDEPQPDIYWIPGFVAAGGREYFHSTFSATIIDTKATGTVGLITVTAMYDQAAVGVVIFFAVGVEAVEIVLVDSVLCKEMAKQLIKVFGGGSTD